MSRPLIAGNPPRHLDGDIFPSHDLPHALAEGVHHVVHLVAWCQDPDAQRFVTVLVPRGDGAFEPDGVDRLAFFVTHSAGPYRVAIWDLLVGPGKKMAAPATLPGGAVFEVRTGTGRIEIDGAGRELRGGVAFVVHQGSTFAITNGEDAALAIRVTLIAASAS